jgi:hypothetical protein
MSDRSEPRHLSDSQTLHIHGWNMLSRVRSIGKAFLYVNDEHVEQKSG